MHTHVLFFHGSHTQRVCLLTDDSVAGFIHKLRACLNVHIVCTPVRGNCPHAQLRSFHEQLELLLFSFSALDARVTVRVDVEHDRPVLHIDFTEPCEHGLLIATVHDGTEHAETFTDAVVFDFDDESEIGDATHPLTRLELGDVDEAVDINVRGAEEVVGEKLEAVEAVAQTSTVSHVSNKVRESI